MSDRPRKSAWPFYLAAALLVLALPVSYFLLLERAPAPPAPPPAPAKPRLSNLRLAEASGAVQVRRGDGQWVEAEPGEVLRASDAVRTADESHALLIGGEAYRIRMEAGTEVEISELSDSISRLLLSGGMATATVKGEARHTFEVKASGSDALARTRAGTFAMSNNGAGTVAVGTREGEVEFLGGGKVVIVRAGHQSILRPGEGPSEPTPIPSSLLLKVNLPDKATVAKPKLVVKGRVEPGATVEVAGKVVPVDAAGRFSHPVTLSEGANSVQIRARSVGELAAESSHEIRRDTSVSQMAIDRDFWNK